LADGRGTFGFRETPVESTALYAAMQPDHDGYGQSLTNLSIKTHLHTVAPSIDG